MKVVSLSGVIPIALTLVLTLPALAQDAAGQRSPAADFATLEAAQNAANAKAGPRTVPGRSIPVPTTASKELQASIAAPYRVPNWNANPKSAAEWKELINKLAATSAAAQVGVREKLGVTMEPTVIGGVKAFILSPKVIPAVNQNRLLVHVHGGGYVYNPGEAGTGEAALMAAYGGFKVISFDYRMPPDFPYPAAMDDAMAVWKAALTLQDPRNMAIFGTSTGGGMTLAHDPARQAGGIAAAGGDRARYAVVRPHRSRRHLQDQRMDRQRAGELQRLSQPRGAAVRQRTRPQGSAAFADLRRLQRFPARHSHQRHARPVPEPDRADPPQAPPRRRGGRAAGVRGHVARAVQLRSLMRRRPRRRSARSRASSTSTWGSSGSPSRRAVSPLGPGSSLATQVGFTRLAHLKVPISGKPEIGAPARPGHETRAAE